MTWSKYWLVLKVKCVLALPSLCIILWTFRLFHLNDQKLKKIKKTCIKIKKKLYEKLHGFFIFMQCRPSYVPYGTTKKTPYCKTIETHRLSSIHISCYTGIPIETWKIYKSWQNSETCDKEVKAIKTRYGYLWNCNWYIHQQYC